MFFSKKKRRERRTQETEGNSSTENIAQCRLNELLALERSSTDSKVKITLYSIINSIINYTTGKYCFIVFI